MRRVARIKRYITTLQMAQFVAMMVQALFDIARSLGGWERAADSSSRPYPVGLSTLLFFYMITMLLLFRNFYVQDRTRQRAQEATLCPSDSAFSLDKGVPSVAATASTGKLKTE